jgi:tripartite-type tricarboxylate transporter receptor subunit TctC
MKKLLLLLLSLIYLSAAAEDIKIISMTPPGGSIDKIARLIQKHATTDELNFMVDYRVGAGGLLAANHIASVKKGTVFMIGALPLITAPLTNKNATHYDIRTDFIMVDYLGGDPLLLVVKSDSQITSITKLLELSKTTPMPYASTGLAGSNHLISAIIANNNPNFIHIPYSGGPQGILALLSGDVKWYIESDINLSGFIRDRKLTPLAVAYNQRLPEYPNIPTLKEAGIHDRNLQRWYILVANSTADPAIVEHMKQRLREPAFRKELSTMIETEYRPKNINNFLQVETEKVKSILHDFKIE